MIKNNTIQNLGLNDVPKYGLGGGIFSPLIWALKRVLQYQDEKEKESKNDVKDLKSKTKKASTKNNSSKTSTSSTPNTPISTSSASTQSSGNMDWMSDYGSSQTTTGTAGQEVEKIEPFSANSAIWEDPVLSKIDTGVSSRYLKYNLQDLLNLYNTKIAETVGQKRS